MGLGCEIQGRDEDGIKTDTEGILDHTGDDFPQQRAGELETWVGVALDKPYVVGLIDHEVQTKDLEVVLALLWVH